MLPFILNFLEEISSLSHSIVVLYFSASITEEGFLISYCYSLKLDIQKDISFLFSFAFHASLLFSAVCKASSDNHFAFLHFFFLKYSDCIMHIYYRLVYLLVWLISGSFFSAFYYNDFVAEFALYSPAFQGSLLTLCLTALLYREKTSFDKGNFPYPGELGPTLSLRRLDIGHYQNFRIKLKSP